MTMAVADVSPATKVLLGLGYWVQGFRSFVWINLRFFLKDGLGVPPGTLQLVISSADIPLVAKPVYGVISDAVQIGQQRRLPYISIGAALQASGWISLALLSASYTTVTNLSAILCLAIFGGAISEVANDAIIAEVGRAINRPGYLESFVWMFLSSGGVLGCLSAGFTLKLLSPRVAFFLYGLLLILQFVLTMNMNEQSLGLYQRRNASYLLSSSSVSSSLMLRRQMQDGQFILSTNFQERALGPPRRRHGSPTSLFSSILKKCKELLTVVQRRDIFYEIFAFALSSAIIPNLTGTMFYYQTEFLKLDSSIISMSRMFKQGCILLWSVAYNRWLKAISPGRIMSVLQGVLALFMLLDILFVKGVFRYIGVSDTTYVIVFTGLIEAQYQFAMLPFTVLMVQLCPSGCEGSLMALVMSIAALSGIISGYFGVALASFVEVSGDDFSRLVTAILLQATFTVLPLYII